MIEPYNLSLQEIARLTDWQIANLLFCPRDDDRLPLPLENEQEAAELSYEDLFRQTWKDRGCNPQEIERCWQEWLGSRVANG